MTNQTQSNPVGSHVKRRLGRGLSSLIGDPVAVAIPPEVMRETGAAAAPSSAVGAGKSGGVEALAAGAVAAPQAREASQRLIDIPVEDMGPSPFQPRRVFDETALNELASSIRAAGVVQPVVVRVNPAMGAGVAGKKYEIVAGERRWRAAQRAGLKSVPAVVAAIGDEQAAEWALIENLQRADLGPMERARALAGLCERFALTHAQAAERVGMDRSSVTNLVRLTELEPEIASLLEDGRLTLGHGKALLTLSRGAARVQLASQAAKEEWSVRRLEEESRRRVRIVDGGAPTKAGAGAEHSAWDASDVRRRGLADLEKQLGEHLGTKVTLKTNATGKKGRIVIEFFDLDHFDGVTHRMGFSLR